MNLVVSFNINRQKKGKFVIRKIKQCTIFYILNFSHETHDYNKFTSCKTSGWKKEFLYQLSRTLIIKGNMYKTLTYFPVVFL